MLVLRVVKKFNMLLTKHQKLRIIELVILMIIGGILETLSVSLILPFMELVMNPDSIMNNTFVINICSFFNISSSRIFLVILAILLAVVYLLKNFYLLFEYNFQYRFVYGNMFIMQQKLHEAFLSKPYEYFLGISSGEVIRIINNDTRGAFQLLTILLQLFTELVVSAMLISTVFIMAPQVTLIMAVILLGMVIVLNSFFKPILKKAGTETQDSLAGMNKWLLQSIQGIKEIKVSAKEDYFRSNYDKYGKRYVNALRKYCILDSVPRFFIEALCMSTVFVLIGIYLYNNSNIEAVMPILSAVAMAAMRLLPSVNRITQSLAAVSYNEPMLDKLWESLKNMDDEEKKLIQNSDCRNTDDSEFKSNIKFRKEIAFDTISYRYPKGEKNVLENASMSIRCGQAVGIVGTTGSGKTTSVDILLGLLSPQKGQVLIDGVDISDNLYDWHRQLGYIPQEIFMLDDSIRVNVAFGEQQISDSKVWKALDEAELGDFVRGLPEGLDTSIGERGVRLSGGQKQRIGIARSLYNDPDIIVFDEATSALDNETEYAIMESINSLHGKKTLIIIAHRLTTIEKCDVVYKVEDGLITRER